MRSVGLACWASGGFSANSASRKPLAEIGPMELDDPALEKYKDQIEKDLANFE